MDGYLRLVLLAVAIAIVFFILFEAWHRSRLSKQTKLAAEHSTFANFNPDTVLGLDEHEPRIDFRAPSLSDHKTPQKMVQLELTNNQIKKPSSKSVALLNDLIVITVVAKPDNRFASYDLLQAITAAGLQFGEMNIFHYKVDHEILFSLASANEPGDFNLDRIGDFSCTGLTLFSNLREISDPEKAFELMVRSAEQLADDLDGELRAGTRKPWTEEAFLQLQDKAYQFQLVKHD